MSLCLSPSIAFGFLAFRYNKSLIKRKEKKRPASQAENQILKKARRKIKKKTSETKKMKCRKRFVLIAATISLNSYVARNKTMKT